MATATAVAVMTTDALATLVGDLRAFLGFIGPHGRPLTGTGRLRLADVRAADALLATPETQEHLVAGRISGIRTEDEAPRVHFLRLIAEAGDLAERAGRRLTMTGIGIEFAAGGVLDGERLFSDWWWVGAWDLLSRGWAVAQRGPEENRDWTARELGRLGEADTKLTQLGRSFAGHFGPPAAVHRDLHEDMWGRSVLWMCLRPLEAFGGCVLLTEHQRIEPLTESGRAVEWDETVGFRLTPRGLDLLRTALRQRRIPDRRTAISERRAAPGPAIGPEPRSGSVGDAATMRRVRVALSHPEQFVSVVRGKAADAAADEAQIHMLLHEGVQEMLESGDLLAVSALYARLVRAGHDPHEVEHLLAEAVRREVLEEGDARFADLERFASRVGSLAEERFAGPSEQGPLRIFPARTLERLRSLPRSAQVWEGDVLNPPPGCRRELPATVRVNDGVVARRLREALAPVGVGVELAVRLPALDLLLSTVSAFVSHPRTKPHPDRRRRWRHHRRGRADRFGPTAW